MCGRYTLTTSRADLARAFDLPVEAVPEPVGPRYNIAPTEVVPVLRGGERRFELARWGLVPARAKDLAVGSRMINARSETLSAKPSFRDSFRARRCLVPADGFYEWVDVGPKQPRAPHYIRLKGGGVFAFAGLWDVWKSPDGRDVTSFTIVTADANRLIQPIHDRMPVILPAEHRAAWLDPDHDDTDALSKLLVPHDPDLMETYPVSRYVNSVRNEGELCILPSTELDLFS